MLKLGGGGGGVGIPVHPQRQDMVSSTSVILQSTHTPLTRQQ